MPAVARRAVQKPERLLAFDDIEKPLALRGCDDLEPIIRAVLHGWHLRAATDEGPAAPEIVIQRTKRGYQRTSPWLARRKTFTHPVDAVCDFLVDLIWAYIAAHPHLLCLHTAAVELNGGLALFPNVYKAGKSTLSVHCAAAGFRVFGDDVLPVDGRTKEGIAPGILPRLRLPLPDGAGPAFNGFVARHEAPRSERYLYVDLDADRLAPHGTRAPITAIVIPERIDDGTAALAEIGTGEALKRTILRNFSRDMPASDILAEMHDIVAGAQCFELRYRTGEEAVDLLRRIGCSTA